MTTDFFDSQRYVVDTKLDIASWIDSREAWGKGKRMKYLKNMLELIDGKRTKTIGTFKAMVKSGEQFTVDEYTRDDDGYITGVSNRPRNICVPDDDGCSLLTMIQSHLWRTIKQNNAGF